MRRIAIFLLPVLVLLLSFVLYESPRPASAQESLHESIVSLETAERVIESARKKAEELDAPVNIAVVGIGGHLKSFIRMDGALLGSVDISIRKARTARLFDAPTGALGQLSQPGGPLYGIEESNDGLITFAGGLPLRNTDGAVIGAIGVSGSTVENDQAIAEAGLNAL